MDMNIKIKKNSFDLTLSNLDTNASKSNKTSLLNIVFVRSVFCFLKKKFNFESIITIKSKIKNIKNVTL